MNIDKGEYNIAAFLDLRKAFDTVNHEVMLYKLFLYGVRGIELKWFSSYLKNGQQFCAYQNVKSDFRMVTCGIPQGSCLGPVFFLIYVNDLPFVVKNSKPGLYADDTGLTVSNSDLQTLPDLISEDLREIDSWLCMNRLSIDTIKTKYMILSSKAKLAKIDQNPKILIQNKKIKRVGIADYLCITSNESLDWKKQLNNLCTKISSAVFSLNQVKYLPPNSIRTVYKSLIEPILKYCAAVWGNCGKTLKHKVQRLQDRTLGILSKDRENRNHDDCLRVQQLIDQEIAVTVFKSLNGNAPNYLKQMFVHLSESHNYNTRNHSTGLFQFHTNTSSGQKSSDLGDRHHA